MKNYIKTMLIIGVLFGIVSLAKPSFSYIYNKENTIKGLRNVQPNDELNFPDNTVWSSLTAIWGVRVEFIDYDESIIKSEVVEVSDEQKGNTLIPNDPIRKNYKFMGWTRYDENTGLAYINDDGTLSDIIGPGPIIYIANYQIVDDNYKVDYVIEDDNKWGSPDESITPIDNNSYVYNDTVKVLSSDESLKGYAIDDENGKKIPGTWKFELDEDNNPKLNEENEFNIIENTEVKGTWSFEPDKLRVEYITKNDELWGKPSKNIMPTDYDLYNYKDNVNIINKERIFEGTATNLKTGKSVSGKWELVVDGLDTIITENMTINAQWKFTPNTTNNPKTGDNINYYIIIGIISLLGIIISLVLYVKKNSLKDIKNS